MPRLMSVAFTADAVIARTKTVTRRKGWAFLKPGDRLTLCRKVQGRKKGEPIERLAEVEVTDVRREELANIARRGELEREGCGHMTPCEFVKTYFKPQGIYPADEITRIAWRHLDGSGEHLADQA